MKNKTNGAFVEMFIYFLFLSPSVPPHLSTLLSRFNLRREGEREDWGRQTKFCLLSLDSL